MKPIEGYDKLRGGYYTPDTLAAFLTDWAIRTPEDRVLEPSCGDGSFLRAITARLRALGCGTAEIYQHVLGIELDQAEAAKAEVWGPRVLCGDFFTYYQHYIDGKTQFDVIVGNPPFIRYQNFTEAYRAAAFALLEAHGFHPNRLTNIWLPFLLLSCKALTPGGRVGMVIPAELFQVDYAAEARQFLSAYFQELNLVTFQRLVFPDIQQEVILLLGQRRSGRQGIRVISLENDQTLGPASLRQAEVKRLDHSQDKWVKYYLTQAELDLLSQLGADRRISDAADLFEVNVGLVSGENTFFVVNRETVDTHSLGGSVLPIISRSEQLKGLRLTEEDYDALAAAGKKVFFFAPGDRPFEELSGGEQRYILLGEGEKYNENYKCRIRPRWYHVPLTWQPEAFLIRQAHACPRMILNEKGALVTDTLHKVRFRPGVSGPQTAAAFLNTYTFALSETIGRSYGGGVLTFEPGEIRRMRIPMVLADQLDLDQMDLWLRQGDMGKILTHTDDVLLRRGLGLSSREVDLLHSIWGKLQGRRIARKSQKPHR